MGTSVLSLVPDVRQALSRARVELGHRNIEFLITSTFRTKKEQARLYRSYQAGKTSYPVAPPGSSRHEYGLAVDLVTLPPDALPVLVAVFKAVGFKWAGPQDSVHFDYVWPLRDSKRLIRGAKSPQAAPLTPKGSLPIIRNRGVSPVPLFGCPW